MDDHPSTASQNSLPTDIGPVLDAVTEELKAEFARLEQVRCLEASTRALEELIGTSCDTVNPVGITRHFSETLAKVRRLINSLENQISVFGYTQRIQQKLNFWTAVLRAILDALAKLNALLAHSLRATLRIPLLLDGPELSGYKHRLR
ncbi:hypothetical protein [Pseudomonas sp. SDO5271_S396]